MAKENSTPFIKSISRYALMQGVVVMILLFIGTAGNAQAADTTMNDPFVTAKTDAPTALVADANNDRLELVIWFMGSKQMTPVDGNDETSMAIGKKSFINCGMKPNRTLSKSFLKKAVNYESTLA